ncbi:hypothetical protein BH09PSE6_BH09PSE6_32700 [soil metagenome]
MSAASLPEAARFGRVEIVAAERRLLVDGHATALGSRAFDLLVALVARRERIVPKDELIDVVWPGLIVEENNLQVQISALRKVLGTQAIATIPGRGYQFTLAATPDAPAAAPGKPIARAAVRAPGVSRSSNLLVADDNKVNRLLLCRSLELMGHQVSSVDNGRAALEALRAGGVDLLLLDLEMPEMDGFELLEHRTADAALQAIPVIVTSSIEGAPHVARCIELGAEDFLHKPVNPMLLRARVESSLERKHLRDRERELLARMAPGLATAVDGSVQAKGVRSEATMLVARLHDLDALAMTQTPQETLELLGSWSTLMVDAVEGQGGVVAQMTGDGLTAVFEADASNAARAALELLELLAGFNAERTSLGKPAVLLGVGMARGEVVSGSAGPPRRASHACIGAAVRRAAALEALASAAMQVLIDEALKTALGAQAATDSQKPVVLPGSPKAAPVHALRGLR